MSLSLRGVAIGSLLLQTAAAAGATTAHAAAPVPQKIAELSNVGGVANGATAAATFTTTKPWHIVQVWTYHWNSAKGAAPGKIGLRDLRTGKVYGPWQATGSDGQGGVPNANWTANVKVDLPAGRYRVTDSSPASWAQNAESGGRGFFYVLATPLAALAWPPLPSALVSIESVSNGCGGVGIGAAALGAFGLVGGMFGGGGAIRPLRIVHGSLAGLVGAVGVLLLQQAAILYPTALVAAVGLALGFGVGTAAPWLGQLIGHGTGKAAGLTSGHTGGLTPHH